MNTSTRACAGKQSLARYTAMSYSQQTKRAGFAAYHMTPASLWTPSGTWAISITLRSGWLSLQYYLRELQSKPYVYGTDCLPWDGGTPSLQTGRSIRDQMIAAGRRVKVMPQMKVEQGITAARTIFGKCFFDAEKCADGIQALRHYRYEVEEAKSDPAGGHIALSKVPRHDWASHGADAFRTAAVMIREPEKKKEPEKRRPAGKLSPWS